MGENGRVQQSLMELKIGSESYCYPVPRACQLASVIVGSTAGFHNQALQSRCLNESDLLRRYRHPGNPVSQNIVRGGERFGGRAWGSGIWVVGRGEGWNQRQDPVLNLLGDAEDDKTSTT